MLHYLASEDATLYFDMLSGDTVTLILSRRIGVVWTDAYGNVRGREYRFTAPNDGIFRACLKADGGEALTVTLDTDGNVMPFLMPGQGVLWNHGMIFPLLLAKNESHTVWALPDNAFSVFVSVIKGIPFGTQATVTTPDGEVLTPDWNPNLGRSWFWHSAEFHLNKPFLRFDFPPQMSDIRFTMTNTAVVSLVKPIRDFRTGKVRLYAADEQGRQLDARFSFYVGGERVVMYDILEGEDVTVTLPQGKYRMCVSAGICRRTYETDIAVGEGTQSPEVILAKAFTMPKGWVLGELHTHSAYEDATLYPEQIMRAARANGRQFCIETDKDVDALLKYGTSMYDIPNRFLGLPGQEIMCHELHMNILNTDTHIDNPEADNFSFVSGNIEEKIAGWISVVEEMKKRRPCTFMLNHPSHRPEVMKGSAYFRSWWVADRFEKFGLVENCDYDGWFDRLNRGRRLHAAWTGDGHDSTLMYPGKEGVCVFVGENLTAEALIQAIEDGRFFSTCEPGAFMDIAVHDGKVAVDVRTAKPIDTVELVGMGSVKAKWKGCDAVITADGEYVFHAETDLPQNVCWVMARCRLDVPRWEEAKHSFTPFMVAGYETFTNPIWILQK